MTKKQKLEQIDNLVSDKLLEALQNDKLEDIPLLSNAMKYLAINKEVSEKTKVTASDKHNNMIQEAKKRMEESASTK